MLATAIRVSEFLIVLIVSFGLLASFAIGQDDEANPEPEKKAGTAEKQDLDDDSEQDESDDEAEEENTDQESEESGQDDLDKAFDLKINAASTRDLDEVADLCESAIEKGLDEESELQAKELWSGVLYEHAKQLQRRIAPRGTLATRWRWLRREAISRLNDAIEVNPKKTDAMILLAHLHSYDAGDRDAALEAIEKAIAQITDDKEKLSRALFIRSQLAEDDKARIADLTQAVKINPKNFEALMQRAMFYLNEDKKDEAMADFESLLAIDKKNSARYVLVADELRRQRMFKESASILNSAIELEPENGELLVMRSRAFLGTEDVDSALEDLNKAIEINRQNVAALNLRARVYINKDEFEKALEDANEVMQQRPEETTGLELRSLVYQADQKLDKALEDAQTLLEIEPDNMNFKFNLGLLYSRNDQPSKAIPIYDLILRNVIEPAKPQIYRNRGDAYLSLGKHARAIEDYQTALDMLSEFEESLGDNELSEDDKEVKSGILNNLAWVLATSPDEKTRDGKRAVEMATEASELTDYKAAFILSTLASGYAENGDFETARKWAAKAVELAESDEQRVGLQEELDSYKQDKPWREIENVEEEKKKKEAGKEAEKESEKESEKDVEGQDDSEDSESDSGDDKDSGNEPDKSDKETEDDTAGDNNDSGNSDDDGNTRLAKNILRSMLYDSNCFSMRVMTT